MRVIAGRLRGHKLVAPHGLETRPTADRVREALFSMLAGVGGAHVLDLYAGTGALGIESLSRGATSAVFVESSRPALAALRQNLASLALTGSARVLADPVSRSIPRIVADATTPFDLVFADPPYDDVDTALAALEALVPVLAPTARIVLEHSERRPPRPRAGSVRSRLARLRLGRWWTRSPKSIDCGRVFIGGERETFRVRTRT
jgi:16S rRNA (guanine966-N2)-methyltransferase